MYGTTTTASGNRALDKVNKTLQNTTAHGLPRIFDTNNIFIKLMWILLFLACLAVCIYFVATTIIQYNKFETKAKVSIERAETVDFPAVTFCNLNAYDYYKNPLYFNEFSIISGLNDGLDWSKLDDGNTPSETFDISLSKLKRNIANDIKKKGDDSFELRKSLGWNLEDQMLLSCSFNNKRCNAANFNYFWSNEYGICYTFNSGKDSQNNPVPILQTSRDSLSYGLKIELVVGHPTKSIGIEVTIKNGIFVIVHNQSTPVQYLMDGITVATGLETYIPVKRTFVKKLDSPYSDCLKNLDQFRSRSDYTKTLYGYMSRLKVTEYDQRLCYKLCFQDQLNIKCSCSEFNIPLVNDNSLYCDTDEQLSCLNTLNEKYTFYEKDNICQKSCPSQCNSLTYDLSNYGSTYPTRFYLQQIVRAADYVNRSYKAYNALFDPFENNLTVADIIQTVKENILKVIINYNDISYTVVEESPEITVEALIGILGGHIGLFIGISVLSFFEILELLIRIIAIFSKVDETDQQIDQQNYPQSVVYTNNSFGY